MGLVWINGSDTSDAPFSTSCPNTVNLLPSATLAPTTGSPSKTPTTSFPTKSPTINVKCLGYTQAQCPSPRCYYQEPNQDALNNTLAGLTNKQKEACLSELGCRPSTPAKLFCNYSCKNLCNLDSHCTLNKVNGKSVCQPKV